LTENPFAAFGLIASRKGAVARMCVEATALPYYFRGLLCLVLANPVKAECLSLGYPQDLTLG
jgi:hypothetical protein